MEGSESSVSRGGREVWGKRESGRAGSGTERTDTGADAGRTGDAAKGHVQETC